MKSLRLSTIASFVENDDILGDIGCDHAYLSIYLVKNNLCKKVIATDVNINALNVAKSNIKKNKLSNEIETYLSDGLQNVCDKEINTLVISGMGTNTILHILDHAKEFNLNKLIIQSNNELYKLRNKLPKYGFYLQKEKVIYEKKHFYVIGVYKKVKKYLTLREKLFGKYDATNSHYYLSLYNEFLNINKKVRSKNVKEKLKILCKIALLKKYL